MRIRTRLLILVLSVLIPSFIGAAVAVAWLYDEEKEFQTKGLTEATRAFALLVDNELQIKAGILSALATSPPLLEGDLAKFYDHAKQMAPTQGAAIILFDLEGRQLLNTRVPRGTPLPAGRFSDIGTLMRQHGQDRMLVSDLFVAPLFKTHDFSIQVPVRIGQQIRYFLLMSVNASALQHLFVRQHFPDHWAATVVDRKGVVVARSRNPEQRVGTLVGKSSRARIASTAEAFFEGQSLDGKDVRAFFSTVPNANWKVLVSIPADEFSRVPLQAAALLGGLMAVLLALGLLAAHRFANRAIAPIEYLGRSAEGLGHGEELHFEPQGVVEIDSVAQQVRLNCIKESAP
jgi:hypothetical protein